MKKLLLLLVCMLSWSINAQVAIQQSQRDGKNITSFTFNNTITYFDTGGAKLSFERDAENIVVADIPDQPAFISFMFTPTGTEIKDIAYQEKHEILYQYLPKEEGTISSKTFEVTISNYSALCVENINEIGNNRHLSITYVIIAPKRLITVNYSAVVDKQIISEYQETMGKLWRSIIEQKISM